MKYKIIALSVASVIGISTIVQSSDNNKQVEQYLYGGKEPASIEININTSISDNTFTKGDMFALSQGANKKANDDEEDDELDDEDTDSEESEDEEIDDSDEADEEGEDEEDGEEIEEVEETDSESSQIDKNIKGSSKKRKSHDMAVESGKHGKTHNLLKDAFFYMPEGTVLPEDGLIHSEKVGLAKTLRGSICVCTFFVSEKNWKNDNYHKLYKKNLEIAEKWLTREAKKYGSTITFENIYPLGDTAIVVDKLYGLNENDPDAYGSFRRVLKSLGLSCKDFKKKIRYETQCENIVTNFIIDKDGRSYCFLDYAGSNPDDYHDFSWIFKSGWGQAIEAGTIAHETLHAFGAFDLYESEGYRKEQSDAAQKYYPNEIMLTGGYGDINKSYISPVTAWKVGIGEKSKALEFFVPDGECYCK